MTLSAFTYVTEMNRKNRDLVQKITESFGFALTTYCSPWEGFGKKLLFAIKSAEEFPTTHIMLMDACDIIITAPKEEIIERYNKFNHPFVCMAEVNCFPHPDKADLYPYCETPFRYVNGGCYIAEKKYLLDLFTKYNPKLSDNDQVFLTDIYLKEPGSILLDTNCELFQSLIGVNHLLELSKNKIYNIFTNTYPLIAHHNGGGDITDDYAGRLIR